MEVEKDYLKSPEELNPAEIKYELCDLREELEEGNKDSEEAAETLIDYYFELVEAYGSPQALGGRAGDQTIEFRWSPEEDILTYSQEIINSLQEAELGEETRRDLEKVKVYHSEAILAYESALRGTSSGTGISLSD